MQASTYRHNMIRHLELFDENPGKSLGLHILPSITIYIKKHAISPENEMTRVFPECIWIIKSNAFTLSDLLNISDKYLTEKLLKNYWQLYKALAGTAVMVLVPI